MFWLRCDETGDRSLDRAGAQGEKDPVDRKDHLIDPETFGADRAGEKDGKKAWQLRNGRRIRLYICGSRGMI